jgi:hypothetical protein
MPVLLGYVVIARAVRSADCKTGGQNFAFVLDRRHASSDCQKIPVEEDEEVGRD